MPQLAVVADIAERTHTTLVVDETMVNLWYDAPPPPPLAAFNRDAPIILLGSAGKSFWGGLRLGWIRASARTIAALVQTRDTFDWAHRCLNNSPPAGYWITPPTFFLTEDACSHPSEICART